MEMDKQTPHVAFLISPGIGHLIPTITLAKQLLHHHHFSATLIIPSAGPPSKTQNTLLQSLPKSINFILLPPVQDLPENLSTEAQIGLTMIGSLPSLRETLMSLLETTQLVALAVDGFGLDALDVTKELGISPYLFFTASALVLLFCLYFPKLDAITTCEYRDLPHPIELPGCVPLHGAELLDPVQDRTHPGYKVILEIVNRFTAVDGIILNSFLDLEEGAIKALQMEEPDKPPVYVIGPLIQNGPSHESNRPECLKWLDDKPNESVLFVSFGSGGTLSQAQIDELAFGLEMSGQNFLWVVKSPNEKANATYFSVQSENDSLSFLPDGFLQKTKLRGMVLTSWAPQIEVLSHKSTGGFVTHCGWNSILESVVQGVPLIAWPLYAEQRMNAPILAQGLKVALRPKVNENGIVGREEIARVVRELMEGEEGKNVRLLMQELKHAAVEALREDGSSTKTLSKLAMKLKDKRIN